jgi:ABC-type multidrug transport system fused ATPase/permease subunit
MAERGDLPLDVFLQAVNGKIIFVIAHRLSTIPKGDRIKNC